MLTATVTQSAGSYTVTLQDTGQGGASAQTETSVPIKDGPSPIVPEINELVWSAGAFVVFAVLMRYYLYPRLRKGISARYDYVRDSHTNAANVRAAAIAEVADYEEQLNRVRAEAAALIEEGRRVLEAERNARLAEVNSEIAARRAAAVAENDAARRAVQSQIESAVGDVSSRAAELAVGRPPDPDLVSRVVADVIGSGVAR